MITQETAAKIWACYRDIEAGKKLLADLSEKPDSEHDTYAPRLKDAFGHPRHLQLGVPSGENSHRLFEVHPDLAMAIIKAHIGHKLAELNQWNEAAKIEATTTDME